MEWPSKDMAVQICNESIVSFEEEVKTIRAKMEDMTEVYDTLQEKMQSLDKTM